MGFIKDIFFTCLIGCIVAFISLGLLISIIILGLLIFDIIGFHYVIYGLRTLFIAIIGFILLLIFGTSIDEWSKNKQRSDK